jgi:hypothetical protein
MGRHLSAGRKENFYLRAAISDCLLIGFIRERETLRKNWNKQFDIGIAWASTWSAWACALISDVNELGVKGSESGAYKKVEAKGLGPRWGPVKTAIFENEPTLFCCRYCRWRAKYCRNIETRGVEALRSAEHDETRHLWLCWRTERCWETSVARANQSQKTVLPRGLSVFLYWYLTKNISFSRDQRKIVESLEKKVWGS